MAEPLSLESARQSRGVSSYTELRDSVDGEAGTAWRQADKEAESYAEFIQNLREDNRFSDEHKASEAWQRYLKSKEVVETNREKARQKLAQQAATARRFSIPMPREQGLHATSDSAIIASQNEASRLVRQVDRMRDSKSPFRPDPAEVLREVYGRGLGIGGVQGAAICRGTLSAAEEPGVGTGPSSVLTGRRGTSTPWSVPRATRGCRSLSAGLYVSCHSRSRTISRRRASRTSSPGTKRLLSPSDRGSANGSSTAILESLLGGGRQLLR